MAAGVHPVQPGAHHGHGGTARVQRAGVGGTVHTQRHARHHTHACGGQRLCEIVGVLRPLWGGVAAAHHGQTLRVGQQVGVAHQKQQQRRVGGFQQLPGVSGVGQSQDVVTVALGQPSLGGGPMRLKTVRRGLQGLGLGAADHLAQHRHRLSKHLTGQPQRRQQLAGTGVAHARGEAQAKPGRQVSIERVHGADAQGLAKRSPTFTPSLICSTRP